MDYNHTEQPNMNFQQPPFNPYRKKPNRMANLSLILGVLTLLSVISIYFIYGSASWLYEYPVRPSVQR